MNGQLFDRTDEPPACPVTDRLSEYLDGELTAEERTAVEEHLETCVACREALDDLREVVARAAALAPLRPARDLWSGVEARVARIRPARAARFSLALSAPQLAAAAVLLLALAAGLLLALRDSPTAPEAAPPAVAARPGDRRPPTTLPVSLADDTYDRAIGDLERALQEGRERLDPRTIAVVERNLAAIDAAIAQARAALEADPSNTYLNAHLADARNRKLAILRRVSAMASPEG